MSSNPIVVATDGSEESLRAVDWAAREAVLRGAPLRIVSGAELLPRMMERTEGHDEIDNVTDVLVEDRDMALVAAGERAAKVSPDLLIDTDHLTGGPALAVTESGSGALMLVVGSRGVGAFTALILGSVSRYAATHATCPVVVVRDETVPPRGQIAVGIGDRSSHRVRRPVPGRARRQQRQRHAGAGLHLQRHHRAGVDHRAERNAGSTGQVPGRDRRRHR